MNNRYMSNNIERNATWRVGVYCRLSKDDELTGESASISNQRDILVNYCQSQGWQVVDVFQDDGYTGLNTDRPDLQRLLKACEKGLVNLVITKDQSRLGRNHVQTGFLMEEFFPKHGVRYIALYDNVDTFAGDNEIAPSHISRKQSAGALCGKNLLFHFLQSVQRMTAVEKYMIVISGEGKCTGSSNPAGGTCDQYIFLVHNLLHFQKNTWEFF